MSSLLPVVPLSARATAAAQAPECAAAPLSARRARCCGEGSCAPPPTLRLRSRGRCGGVSPRTRERDALQAAAMSRSAEQGGGGAVVHIRLVSGGPAGAATLHDVDARGTTVRALLVRWAAAVHVDAALFAAALDPDPGADASLAAAGVVDGSTLLVSPAPGFKLIALRVSPTAPLRTAVLGSDAGLSRLLKQYNAAALEQDADGPPDDARGGGDGGGDAAAPGCAAYTFGALHSGAAYRLVPLAENRVHNVTLDLSLLPPHPTAPLRFTSLTDGGLADLLRAWGASGVSPARDARDRVLTRYVTDLTDSGTYFLVPAEGDASVASKVANLVGHNANVATGFEHEAAERVRGIVSRLHPGVDVRRARDKLFVAWLGRRLEVDEVVYIDGGPCAYVIEAENVLSEASGDELQKRLDSINGVKDAPWCPPELRLFAGKRVHGVLCGRSVALKQKPSPVSSVDALVADWTSRGYKLLLPSGASLASGDSLFRASEFTTRLPRTPAAPAARTSLQAA